MNQLFEHNNSLKSIYSLISESNDIEIIKEKVHDYCIDAVLRNVITIEDMRSAGSFFTDNKLADELANKFARPITDDSIILDPTCGAGNLLISCSRKLGIKDNLSTTLSSWGKCLQGYDLYESFVESTKIRLVLEAISRGCKVDCSIEEATSYFKHIKVADTMQIIASDVSTVTHCAMNPPFAYWNSEKTDFWNKGKINSAAVVCEHFVRILPKHSEISAILPEVLRSGSRYEKWRDFIQSKLQNTSIEILGRFSAKTNVDVFVIQGKLDESQNRIKWIEGIEEEIPRISDEYKVSVGPLVAYRDPEEGEEYPYIHAKNIVAWKVLKDFAESRRFKGTVMTPPFVVIQRTSGPTSVYRATGSIITGKSPVAVENHLIIIKPNRPTIANCKKLLKLFKEPKTNDFLNERIRCRHLTVGAVKQIPLIK